MPGRKTVLATGQIYHIINRGVASQPIFSDKTSYQRARETIFYYQNQKAPLSYANFLNLPRLERARILTFLRHEKNFRVEIIALCLMPNHIHLLLKQLTDNGISTFMSQFANSYTRYFNVRSRRAGHLFQGKFKAVRIETDEQLLHVSRYIHLNPYSSYLVKTIEELKNYPYSSLPEYLGIEKTNLFQKDLILNEARSPQDYQKFVFDQADYQRSLEDIKHLALEK